MAGGDERSIIGMKEADINLTREQLQAVQRGERLRFAEAGGEFVVLYADVYERLTSLLDYDDNPWTDEEMDLLAAEDADSLDWEGMEDYQDEES
jgi:hypothetical protein